MIWTAIMGFCGRPIVGRASAILASVFLIFATVQTTRLHWSRATVEKQSAQLTLAKDANTSNLSAIKTLKDANDEFARINSANKQAFTGAIKSANDALALIRSQRDAARTQLDAELRQTPDGEKLSATDIAGVLPDVAKRLRVLSCATGPDRDCHR